MKENCFAIHSCQYVTYTITTFSSYFTRLFTAKWEQVVEEFWRKAASLGGRFFMGNNVLWHRPVRSIAVGCNAITADRMFHFAVYTGAATPHAFSMGWTTPKIAPFRGGPRPKSNTWFPGSMPVSPPKRHLDRFSRLCRTHSRDQHRNRQTHRQTYRPGHATCDICRSRPHLCNACNSPLKTTTTTTGFLFNWPSLQVQTGESFGTTAAAFYRLHVFLSSNQQCWGSKGMEDKKR